MWHVRYVKYHTVISYRFKYNHKYKSIWRDFDIAINSDLNSYLECQVLQLIILNIYLKGTNYMKSKLTVILFWGVTVFVALHLLVIFCTIFRFGRGFDRFDIVSISFSSLILLAVVGGIVVIAIYVYKDAPKRGMDKWLWMTIATYVPSLLGLIIYLLIRNDHDKQCKML